jgi:hypothetical protein
MHKRGVAQSCKVEIGAVFGRLSVAGFLHALIMPMRRFHGGLCLEQALIVSAFNCRGMTSKGGHDRHSLTQMLGYVPRLPV